MVLVRAFHLLVSRTGTGDGCLFLLEPSTETCESGSVHRILTRRCVQVIDSFEIHDPTVERAATELHSQSSSALQEAHENRMPDFDIAMLKTSQD